ncbi:conserved hypothetical protein [Leishmania infantum JPCM5]|uniref:Uncharacterized protein n=2 Tax=Leishmania infantum TaxID=5671 RepID=E9AGE9_LEIIN|nr:conserved hypothetical protein [Leishmania infantum JPCM5]CBZ08449.1 conserved hypothetical protein [Leishmania infantum JPCM5]|eukprot:XP_003392301.1 conserved hypothetical protein [Leishmania infantum JPCM5]
MPAALQTPPPLVDQDGAPPFSAQRATLGAATSAATVAPTRIPADSSNLGRQRAVPSSSPSSFATVSSPAHIPTTSGAGALDSRPDTPASLVRASAMAAAPPSTTLSRSSSLASSSASSQPAVFPGSRQFDSSTHARESRVGATALEPQRQSPSMVPAATEEDPGSHFPCSAADDAIAHSVPLPLLVEQQRHRIRALVQERDAAAAELSELHTLFQRLHDDYEETTREADGLRLQLSSLRAQKEMQSDEHRLLRSSHARQQERIQQFELEWANNSKHLREQLDALVSERDAMQAQRDACMADSNDLRRQLIQLQAEIHRVESKHREALREQADTHAQQLRSALQEKEEQLQTRAAATRREARLVQQELDQLGAGHTAAHEERESMRWRLSELETVVTKKEQLRAELERMVTMLRSRLNDQEEAARQDAQRYTQRAQDLELLYRGQVAQEQRRAQALQDDLAAARKATQEAMRQQEALQQSHSEQIKDFAARAAKLEDDLRQQLRALRRELEEAQAHALEHEAAARRSQRDAETLRATCSSEQEALERLQQAHTAQAQQLSRAEGSATVLQTRLREKEREAELLRCAMEQATWTREMRQAAHHTLASLLGVPRVSVRGGRRRVKEGEEMEGWSPALQLEWAAEAQGAAPSPSPRKAQQRRDSAPTGAGDTAYVVPEGGESTPSSREVEGVVPSPFKGAARAKRAPRHPAIASDSPQRPPATPTKAAAGQHVEAIEHTVPRDTGQSDGKGHAGSSTEASHLLQPPLLFRAASPLTAAPPLHPGTPRTAGSSSPCPAQGSAGYAAAANSTTAALRGGGAGASPFPSPLRALSFVPAQTTAGWANPLRTATGVARSQPLSTPLLSCQQVGHIYNIPEEEEQQHQPQAAVTEGHTSGAAYAAEPARGYSRTQRPQSATPLSRKAGEVFFDDVVGAPRARGFPARVLIRGTDAGAAVPGSHERQTTSAQLVTASTAQVGTSNTHLTPSTYRGSLASSDRVRGADGARDAQPSFSLGHSLSYDHGASAPGVRAAELIAQLSHPSSAASDKTPAMQRGVSNTSSHRNVLNGGDSALQQYLRDTVQQVLADHGRGGTPQRGPLHAWRQRPDGGSAILAASGYHEDGVKSAGEADEDDFGSASLLRSSVAVPLVRPAPQPASTGGFANGGGATRMIGPGGSSQGDAGGAVAVTRNGSSAAATPHKTAAAVSAAGETVQTNRRESGIFQTLEQLAGRQQQLLQSLGHLPHAVMFPTARNADVPSSLPWQATAADPSLSEGLRSSASIIVPTSLSLQEHRCSLQHQGQREPDDSQGVARSSVGVVAAGGAPADAAGSALTVSAPLPNTDSAGFGKNITAQGHPAAAARYAKGSDAGTDVELDPRQLSYSTTVATTQLTDVKQGDQSAVKKDTGDPTAAAAAVVQGSQPRAERQAAWSSEPALSVWAVAATTASARSAPSVSEVSSLSQLERRFATPF